MKPLLKYVLVLFSVLSCVSYAEKLTLTTEQGFELKADYYSSNNMANRAVLMLHQCNYNRTMYDAIGEQLSQKGIHALSLDFRGFGESANEEFNAEKIQSLPRDKMRAAWSKMSESWPKDVQLAYDHLKSKVGKEGVIGVIGASCGGSQAITLAQKNPIKVMSFFSSGQRDENVAIYKKELAKKPTLIIASEGDGRTFTSAQSLFKVAQNPNTKLLSYKGNAHGYPLLDSDKQLTNYIVQWFDHQLVQ